eukprot:TRINITY_DN22838_c1_g1_i1.p1 TRINITY_DN22838_c1_g1~~TRINITY_DN22838_c1_g1_i1.p1  ORF type:complete len:500 (+),score=159.41 TRINITY_DN22838_c1_g1_i1:54-1553(+)
MASAEEEGQAPAGDATIDVSAAGAAGADATAPVEGAAATSPEAAEGVAGAAEVGAAEAGSAEAGAAEAGAAEAGAAEGAAEAGAAPDAAAEAPAAADSGGDPNANADAAPGDATVKLEEVKVQDATVDMQVSEQDTAAAAVEKLKNSVQGVVDDFGSRLEALPASNMKDALKEWSAQLSSLVQQLPQIVEACAADAATTNAEEKEEPESHSEQVLAELATDMETVTSIRRQLECSRKGRPQEEAENVWADPERAEEEVAELRRVRRQIRCLFGGMISELGDGAMMNVDDLLIEKEDPQAIEASLFSPTPAVGPPPVETMPSTNSPLQYAAPLPQKPPMPPSQRPGVGQRPRSGGTELSSVDNESARSWASTADEAKRKESGGKRRHRRRDDSGSRPREGRDEVREPPSLKKDDGGVPPKQWNWAEEVVKASLDPKNRWEFPVNADGRGPGEKPAAWEQPRVRGKDVASKAWERAEEVQRLERQHNDFRPNPYPSPRGAY